MTLAQKRETAIRTARAEARRNGMVGISAADALLILDDLSRTEPDLIAVEWLRKASPNQVKLFKREWSAG